MILSDYNTFSKAFDYLNEHLFENKLPPVIFTLQRKPHSKGFFHFEKFQARDGSGKMVSEIALNPDAFIERTDLEILSTLAHEMAHEMECHFEEPPKFGYHSKYWAQLMEDIGLMPSATGEHGGKKTGQKVSHYIIEGGLFEKVCGAFLLNNKLDWECWLAPEKEKKEKKPTRIKYTCPDCGSNIWAKDNISVVCKDCNADFVEEEPDEN